MPLLYQYAFANHLHFMREQQELMQKIAQHNQLKMIPDRLEAIDDTSSNPDQCKEETITEEEVDVGEIDVEVKEEPMDVMNDENPEMASPSTARISPPATVSSHDFKDDDDDDDEGVECDRKEVRVPDVATPPAPLRITNFFIEEILKPNFGLRNSSAEVEDDGHDKHKWSPPPAHVHHQNHVNSLAFNPFHHLQQQRHQIHKPHPTHLRHPQLHLNAIDFRINAGSPPKFRPQQGKDSVERRQNHNNNAGHVRTTTPRSHSPAPSDSSGSSFSSPGSPPDKKDGKDGLLWPAWVYCTRYSDRPSSGPRSRKIRKERKKAEEKRPRTAFTTEQLARLKREFDENRYLTEQRRQELANDLKLNESQIKIWFQNKRAKMKKATGSRNSLALQLMAQGLYNHGTSGDNEEKD